MQTGRAAASRFHLGECFAWAEKLPCLSFVPHLAIISWLKMQKARQWLLWASLPLTVTYRWLIPLPHWFPFLLLLSPSLQIVSFLLSQLHCFLHSFEPHIIFFTDFLTEHPLGLCLFPTPEQEGRGKWVLLEVQPSVGFLPGFQGEHLKKNIPYSSSQVECSFCLVSLIPQHCVKRSYKFLFFL